MILKKVTLKNFQCYKDYNASFSNINFIRGKNGTGKTTLGLDAILFGLYGYSKKTLADLPTRDVSKSCQVTLEIDINDVAYTIIRKFPTKLEIIRGEELLNFASSAEAQRYLSGLIGDVNEFKRFRMIDNTVGINFLEEGQQGLKKILFSVSDKIFNDVKEKLNEIKRHREIYNKDKAVVYTHPPYEKRQQILKENIYKLQTTLQKLKNDDRKFASLMLSNSNKKGNIEGQLKTATWQQEQSSKSTHCYACKQTLLPETKNKMIKEKSDEIVKMNLQLKEAIDIIEEITEIKNQNQTPIQILDKHVNQINTLLLKLEGRLKQKEYIYTQKDIEVVKQALKELDNLSTKYLTKSIQILEPIINSVLEKINFQVKFEINDKGKFNICLTKDNTKFNYKDLSTGQKLLLQIAFKLALLLDRGEYGLLIADEGLSSLDHDNLIHVLNIFENYPFELLMVLHHCDELPPEVKIIDLDITKGDK